MMKRRFLWVWFFCTFCHALLAQNGSIPIGTWKVHLPYFSGKAVCNSPERVYCATDLGLFFFDKASGSIEILSKEDGLSDIGVSAIAYHSGTKTVVIAYSSGAIDLIKENDKIIQVGDLKNSTSIIGSKKINHIAFQGDIALLSGDFGLLMYDLKRNIFTESLTNIGPGTSTVKVNASLVWNDSIYLATSNGLMQAPYRGLNLSDFKSWKTFGAAQELISMVVYQNKINVVSKNTWLQFSSPNLVEMFKAGTESIQKIQTDQQRLVLLSGSKFYHIQNNIPIIDDQITKLGTFLSDVVLESGSTWLASDSRGLVHINASGEERTYRPDGPASNIVFRLYGFKDKMMVLTGGYRNSNYASNGNTRGFYILENGSWKTYSSDIGSFPFAADFGCAVYNPINNHVYIGSHGQGMLEWNLDNDHIELINDKTPGCTFQNLLSPTQGFAVRISALEVDKNGVVWIGANAAQNYSNYPGLHSYNPLNKTFKKYLFNNVNTSAGGLGIKIDASNKLWMINSIGGPQNSYGIGGIFNADPENPAVFREFYKGAGSGNLPDSKVNAFAMDKNGDLWMATNTGVAVFYNPGSSLNIPFRSFEASTPVFENRPLLYDQICTSIAVDGANRKWVGTLKGVYLFSEDGSQQLQFFSSENSPLLSNNINDIAINHQSAEVFFGTDKGLVSYRSNATIGAEDTPMESNVRIFPNPVTKDFNGNIGVIGVSNNAIVKITDLMGRLVYETKANGGMISWDGKNVQGKRVSTGVYLIMSAQENGDFGFVGKILFVE